MPGSDLRIRKGYSALDLAAAAAVWLKQADPSAGVELKRSTRHPAYPRADGRTAGPVRAQEATADLAGLRAWLRRDVGAGAVQEWLEENGLAPGGRYPHTCCPLRPGESSHGEPVFVGEHGLHCHHCASRGLRRGSRTPGFVPYAVLLNAGLSPVIRRLVRNRAHWEHAQVVLAAQYGLSGEVARHAYRALLRLEHDRDPAVARGFTAGADLVRLPGRWATADGATTYKVQYLAHLLGRLPACQLADGRPDPERVDRFRQPSDLTEFGYPAITLLRGCRVYSQHLDFDDPARITAVAPGELLRPESMVQALCRDLLAGALVRLEAEGLPVVLHVHDEAVCEVPAARAEEALRRTAGILSTPPAWAAGFPLKVEGFACERYVKSPFQGCPEVKYLNGEKA
jgi:hypothetical protein